MAVWYRLLVVVDIMDGSHPEDISACLERHHGHVVRSEVMDDETGEEAGHGPPGGPTAGAPPHAMDA